MTVGQVWGAAQQGQARLGAQQARPSLGKARLGLGPFNHLALLSTFQKIRVQKNLNIVLNLEMPNSSLSMTIAPFWP